MISKYLIWKTKGSNVFESWGFSLLHQEESYKLHRFNPKPSIRRSPAACIDPSAPHSYLAVRLPFYRKKNIFVAKTKFVGKGSLGWYTTDLKKEHKFDGILTKYKLSWCRLSMPCKHKDFWFSGIFYKQIRIFNKERECICRESRNGMYYWIFFIFFEECLQHCSVKK